jgi:hypothetical protein
VRTITGEDIKISGIPFFATVERVSWETGDRDLEPLTFECPYDLVRRLTPGTLNTADFMVMALAAVGGVFVFMY